MMRERVAGSHQVAAGGRQARAGVGVAREAERNAVAEDGRAAPDRADRAQPGGVEDVERVEVGADGLGALDVHDRGDRALGEAGADVGGAAAERERPVGDALACACRMPAIASATCCAASAGIGCRQRNVVGRRVHQRVDVAARPRRGHVDREKAAGEAAAAHARQVEVAVAVAFEPEPVARRPARRARAGAGGRCGRRRRAGEVGHGQGSCGGSGGRSGRSRKPRLAVEERPGIGLGGAAGAQGVAVDLLDRARRAASRAGARTCGRRPRGRG